MESFGIKVNLSLVSDEEGYMEAGLHLTNTNGADIDIQTGGQDIEEIFDNILSEAIDQLFEEEKKSDVELLQEENDMLRDEIKFLREKLQKQDSSCKCEKGNQPKEETKKSCEKEYASYTTIVDFLEELFG